MVLDLVEKSTLMVWVTIGETLTISILLCCNEPHGYCDSKCDSGVTIAIAIETIKTINSLLHYRDCYQCFIFAIDPLQSQR